MACVSSQVAVDVNRSPPVCPDIHFEPANGSIILGEFLEMDAG